MRDPKKPLNKVTKILFILSIAILLFGGGYRMGEYNSQKLLNSTGAETFDFKLFWEAKKLLQDKYVDNSKLNNESMFFGAIKGMVAAVGDPYTFFLTPEENQQSKDDLGGKFEGIGAQLGLKNHSIVVIAPLKNSPAQRAGIKSGDIILSIDGEKTDTMSLFDAVSKVRGEKGTIVKLSLLRGEEEIVSEIKREAIDVESVEVTFEPQVAVVRLTRFGDDTQSEWATAMADIQRRYAAGTIKGMVLDMRDNPGGFLEGAVDVSSEFLPQNSLVVKQEYSNGEAELYNVNRQGKLLDIPLVVLINKGSASASEIVAGALRDHKRAKLVGEKSFGKGSIQEAIELYGGSGLHVTIAKWILPKGDWINEKGITPDETLENTIDEGDTLTRESDSQLDKAIEVLLGSQQA